MSLTISSKDIKDIKAAFKRNPRVVVKKAKIFFVRGLAEYRKIIYRSPWRMGMAGGGAPTRSKNLRDTHVQRYGNLEAEIYPTAPYAPYVHGIEGFPRKRTYQLRPWLDYAKKEGDPNVEKHAITLLTDIRNQLAS